jgi:hypothetical protein
MDPAYADLSPDADPLAVTLSPPDPRRYAWVQTRQRLHQGASRDLVISAYGQPLGVPRPRGRRLASPSTPPDTAPRAGRALRGFPDARLTREGVFALREDRLRNTRSLVGRASASVRSRFR